MTNITAFPGATFCDEPVNGLLDKAKTWDMDRVLVVGHTADGELMFGGSFSDAETINWLLDLAKAQNLRDYTT